MSAKKTGGDKPEKDPKKAMPANKAQIAGRARRLDGYLKDPSDERDRPMLERVPQLPTLVDLTEWAPRIEDQGDLGACTAHASTSAMELLLRKAHKDQPELSRLMAYYLARTDKAEDTGSHIRDAVKALSKVGVCREEIWPYDIGAFAEQPDGDAMKDAESFRITEYKRCHNGDNVRHALALGFPIVFGFEVPEHFIKDTERTGILHFPEKGEKMVGAHAVYAVGYDMRVRLGGDLGGVLCVNSWSESWGIKWGSLRGGAFWMPLSYLSHGLASDAWAVKRDTGT